MAIINKQKRKKITSVGDAMEKLESLCTVHGNVNAVAAVKKKKAQQFLKILHLEKKYTIQQFHFGHIPQRIQSRL